MTTNLVTLLVLSFAWLAFAVWTVRRSLTADSSVKDRQTAAFIGLAAFAIVSAVVVWLTNEKMGGTRTRPTRVSDPIQQGDVLPDTLIAKGKVFYVAVDKTSEGKHRVYRYETQKPPKTSPVGSAFKESVKCQHLAKTGSTTLFVGCANGELHACTNPLSESPGLFKQVEPATPGDKVIAVEDIESGPSGVYVLGRTADKAVVCRIADGGATYSRLVGVEVLATAARNLLVATNAPAVSFVFDKAEVTGITAWRFDSSVWKHFLEKKDSETSIEEAMFSQGTVYFTFKPTGGKAHLWASGPHAGGVDMQVADAASLSTDEKQLFVAGSKTDKPTVFTVFVDKPHEAVPLKFVGEAPDVIHGVVFAGMARVLVSRSGKTELWTHADTTLYFDSDLGKFDAPPRAFSADGSCFLVGESSLLAIGLGDEPLEACAAVEGYAAPRLVVQGAHILFVARHKKDEKLAVFSSYLK